MAIMDGTAAAFKLGGSAHHRQQSLPLMLHHQPVAVDPLDFPIPAIHAARCMELQARDHVSGKTYCIKNVIVPCSENMRSNERAYMVKKKLSKSKFGSVRLCVVLRKLGEFERSAQDVDVCWESTDELVAVKVSSISKLASCDPLLRYFDPLREIAALQHSGNSSPYVMECIDALQDDEHIYTVMPYCAGGDLYSRVHKVRTLQTDEAQARIWFRQLIQGLDHLQKKGISHRGIALENMLITEKKNTLVIGGFSLALRVPFSDRNNTTSAGFLGHSGSGGVCDISEGVQRLPMKDQGPCGSLTYLPPEIIDQRCTAFDGYAVDIWSAGILLFVLLVGSAPFQMAHTSDFGYTQVSAGRLRWLIRSAGIRLSETACHLLQNMLQPDPARRLSLAEIMHHPWMQERSERDAGASPKPTPSSKKIVDMPPSMRWSH